MYALGKTVSGQDFHVFGTAVAITFSSMNVLLTCEHNIIEGERLIIVKQLSRAAEIPAELIEVECIYKNRISDLALLKTVDKRLPNGVELCPKNGLPQQLDIVSFCKCRIFYYNVKDFNDETDDVLDCCATIELACQLVDSTSMKWPIVLNDGCSGSAVVDENGMLVGIYRSFKRTVYTVADGKKSLEGKVREKCLGSKREEKLLENIDEQDAVSESLSLSSLSVQHSSYSCTPQHDDKLMEEMDFE